MMSNAMTFENRTHATLRLTGNDAQQQIIATAQLSQKWQDTVIKRLCKIGVLKVFYKIFLVTLREPVCLFVNFATEQLRNGDWKRKTDD
ncbi:MAG: hypothetical protein GAK38_04487 [Xylophilus sp.]|nr:MAG: hypothetical protein GAK38_04487 [Xylophilus sp.]